jgi:hypothetical protein
LILPIDEVLLMKTDLVTTTASLDVACDWAAELNNMLESYFESAAEQAEYACTFEYTAGRSLDMVKSTFVGDLLLLVSPHDFGRLVVAYSVTKGWHAVV